MPNKSLAIILFLFSISIVFLCFNKGFILNYNEKISYKKIKEFEKSDTKSSYFKDFTNFSWDISCFIYGKNININDKYFLDLIKERDIKSKFWFRKKYEIDSDNVAIIFFDKNGKKVYIFQNGININSFYSFKYNEENDIILDKCFDDKLIITKK